MQTTFLLFSYLFTQGLGFLILLVAILLFVVWSLNDVFSRRSLILLILLVIGWFLLGVVPLSRVDWTSYPFSLTTFGPSDGPVLPFQNMLKFFLHADEMPRVENIAADPNNVPQATNRHEPTTVEITLTAKEVVAEMADGISFNYWTFDGQVPGPMLRVRVGDTVRLTLKNDPNNLHQHNIDLHAVTGPGGGSSVTTVAPGEEKTLTFKALNPGLFVYHCAYPNMANHMAHGMYGLILVEPEEGLPPVDREFYVMQGEFYSKSGLGHRGLQIFDAEAMLNGTPTYIVFNGKTGGLADKMTAQTGESVRIFVGNGGVNQVSSFHVVGEIFDRVYPEGSMGNLDYTNVQTTLVPAGGASIVEFNTEVPGNYVLVDHALARVDRGAWGILHVEGQASSTIYDGVFSNNNHGH